MTVIGARNRALDALHARAIALVRVLETNEDSPNEVLIDAAIAEINSAWWRAHPLVLAASGFPVHPEEYPSMRTVLRLANRSGAVGA